MALLAGIALRHDVPYPIVLVLGGLGRRGRVAVEQRELVGERGVAVP